MKFRTIYLALAIIPVILVIIFILNNNNNIPFLTNKKEFDLNIDALKEQQSLL
jgi:hypothetical protein